MHTPDGKFAHLVWYQENITSIHGVQTDFGTDEIFLLIVVWKKKVRDSEWEEKMRELTMNCNM